MARKDKEGLISWRPLDEEALVWLEVNGGLVLRTDELLGVDATHDCIVGSPYSKGRALTGGELETKRVSLRGKRKEN